MGLNEIKVNSNSIIKVENKPTKNSDGIVRSGGLYDSVPLYVNDDDADLDFSDEFGNVLVRFSEGHLKIKNFDSRDFTNIIPFKNNLTSLLYKENGNLLFLDIENMFVGFLNPSDGESKNYDTLYITSGFIPVEESKTYKKTGPANVLYVYFYDSDKKYLGETHVSSDEVGPIENGTAFVRVVFYSTDVDLFVIEKTRYEQSKLKVVDKGELVHIILLGQSLSMGYNSKPCLSKVSTNKALMFKQVKTQDFGYIFNINKEIYNANQESYDNQFYSDVKTLVETGGNGILSAQWESASWNEYETPCSGIVEGLLNCYKDDGLADLPFYTLCTCSGIGGTQITSFDDNSDKIINRTQRDIINSYRLALSRGLTYKPVFIWILGENNAGFTKEYIKTELNTVYTNLVLFLNDNGIVKGDYTVPFISYLTEYNPSGYYTGGNQNTALAQFEMNQEKKWFYLAYPIYNLELASDKVHLTNISSRLMGNSIGISLYHIINGNFNTLKIIDAQLDNNTVLLKFNRNIVADYEHLSRIGYSAEQNQIIQNNYGFFVFDSNSNEISISNISIINNNSVKIVCASLPSEIRYGYKQQTDSYTIGGIIREYVVYKGYDDSNLYLYAPVQYIKKFSSKFIY